MPTFVSARTFCAPRKQWYQEHLNSSISITTNCLRLPAEILAVIFRKLHLRTFAPISPDCASQVRTLFIRHARATSYSSARTESKIQQNIELMTLALTWCAHTFVGFSVTTTFFSADHFSDSFHYTQKKLYVGSFNYFSSLLFKYCRIGT